MTGVQALGALVLVQAACAAFFIGNIVISVLGLPPISWAAHEAIEIGAALGLVLGSGLGVLAVRRSQARTRQLEGQLRLASGAFMDLLEERFADWRLTPAEADVALFSIKGLSIGEIARLRGTSEGTIKAQTNAIYRKAGVAGRPQLLGLFIDDLMEGPLRGSVATSAHGPNEPLSSA